MSLHAHRHPVAVSPPLGALLRPNLHAGGGDVRVLIQAYRRFLRRTSDVSAAARGYPGGFRSLIRDRELVTGLLVRLLQDPPAPRLD